MSESFRRTEAYSAKSRRPLGEAHFENVCGLFHLASDAVDMPRICGNAKAAAAEILRVAADEGRDRFLVCASGDSLSAALGTCRAVRLLSGLDVRAVSSMECARYELHDAASRTVLIALSSTGYATRTREAVALARRLGVPTLGICGAEESPLFRMVDIGLHRPVGPVSESPDRHNPMQAGWRADVIHRIAEHMSTMAALYALGLHMGVGAGTLAKADEETWRGRVRRALQGIGPAAEATDATMRSLAQSMDGIDTVWVLGSGPSRGTAAFTAAKFHHFVPINGVAQDLEEWAHTQYYTTLAWGRRSVAMVIAPRGRSTDRAIEIVQGVTRAGGSAVLVTDDPALHGATTADVVALLPRCEDETLSPVTFHVPGQLLALRLAQYRNVSQVPLPRADAGALVQGGNLRTDFID